MSEPEKRTWRAELQYAVSPSGVHFYKDAVDLVPHLNALEREVEQLRQRPTADQVYEAIKHGDPTHRHWLAEALGCIWQGLPVPAPRSEPTEVEQLRAENEALLSLVRRLKQWDDMPARSDGPYWLREADIVLAAHDARTGGKS